jgi:hypothetical protein
VSARSNPNTRRPKRAKASKELTDYIRRIVEEFSPLVNEETGLQSLLYDIDLLPEQLLHVLDVNPPAAAPNAMRMVAVCELWKARNPEKWAAGCGLPQEKTRDV